MKSKLTLTVSEKIIHRAKRQSKKTGKSLSRMFEEMFEEGNHAPLKTASQRSAEQLLKQLQKSKTVKTLNDKMLLKKYLKKKHD